MPPAPIRRSTWYRSVALAVSCTLARAYVNARLHARATRREPLFTPIAPEYESRDGSAVVRRVQWGASA
jgi:hypothetical protein